MKTAQPAGSVGSLPEPGVRVVLLLAQEVTENEFPQGRGSLTQGLLPAGVALFLY